LGLEPGSGAWSQIASGNGTIVGVLDTGMYKFGILMTQSFSLEIMFKIMV
jgi:hypothetical protein